MTLSHHLGGKPLADFHAPGSTLASVSGQDLDLRLINKFEGLMKAVTEPAPLIAGAVAGPIFSLVRNPMMSWMLSKPAGVLTRGLGLRLLSATAALPGEIAAFGVTQRAVQHLVNPNSLDWNKEAIGHEATSLALTFGLFKIHGRLAQVLVPNGMQNLSSLAGAIGMYSGILHSHLWEERLGWKKQVPWADKLTQSLETFFQLTAMGHTTRHITGPRYNAWVASLEAKAGLSLLGAEKVFENAFSHDLVWSMAGKDGGGSKTKIKIAPVIPIFRNKTRGRGVVKIVEKREKSRKDENFINEDRIETRKGESFNTINEDRIEAWIRVARVFQPERPEGGLGKPVKPYSNYEARFKYLTKVFAKTPQADFNAEKLFDAYLSIFGGASPARTNQRISLAKNIPLDLLLQEVMPVYIHLRRGDVQAAYAELAQYAPFESIHREVWRTTTYLTMQLLQGLPAQDQSLYHAADHLRGNSTGSVSSALAVNLHQLANLRLKQGSELEHFRRNLIRSSSLVEQTLWGIDVFFSHPDNFMKGMREIEKAPPALPSYSMGLAAQVYWSLHVANEVRPRAL